MSPLVFPHVRAVQDYFHLKQALRPKLTKKLHRTHRVHRPRGTKPKIHGAEHKSMVAATPRQRRHGAVYVKTHLQCILKFLDTTRSLPTLQLFDTLWVVFFHMMKVWKESEALQYVQNTYFGKSVSLENVRKSFKG